MDIKKEIRIVAVFFMLFVVSIAEDQLDGGYIFTSQRNIKLGENNQGQLCRFGNLKNDKVTLSLYYSESYNGNQTLLDKKEYTLKEDEQCSTLDFFVKSLDVDNVYNGEFHIEGEIDGECISGKDKVSYVVSKQYIIFIQTDKPIYKAGEIVYFRVLKVDQNLRPPIYKDDIKDTAEIYIEDTKRTRLFQINEVDLSQGIIQSEMQLSDEPVLGDWRITVVNNNKTKSQTFEVKEYVLPKFDVNIKFPPFVLANAENFSVEVCAKYTYGKPVQGELKLNISLETYSYSREKTPVMQELFEINGCKNYTVNVSKIEPDNVYRYRRIQVVASVTEKGTGVQRNKTEFLQRQYQPLNLNFNTDQNYRQYFKPGLPYNGKLKVTNPDDSPAEGEECEICYIVSRKRIIYEWLAEKKVKFCSNFTSNENGIINYTIPPQSTDAESIQLEAKSLKYARETNSGSRLDILNQPSAGLTINPFYSPSGSFIQLETVGRDIPCGSVQEFKLRYTAKQSGEESFNFKIRYEIRRQGTLVQTGYKDINFNSEDDVSKKFENDDELIDDSETQIVPAPKSTSSSNSGSSDNDEENCQVAKEVKYIPPIGEASIPIEVTPELSPSFTLLIYYVRDDRETVADSQKIGVEKCFKNQVDFKFGDEVKQPGTKTSITVTSSPNSVCGLRIVDKSVSLLNSNNQLTKERIFQLLESFDTNNYYSDNPCNEQTPQPGLYAAKSGGIILPPPGRWRSSSYQDSLSAFKDAGLLVISNLILFTRPCRSGGGYDGNIYQAESFSVNKGHAVALASTARRPAAPAMGAGGFAADAKIGIADISSSATKSVVDRTDFPETWLFELQATGPDGVYITKETLPHTITEWEGSAVCVNAEDGLGLSNTTTIKGFQAFFISLTLPYSVIRGEIINIPVLIFNYVDGSLPITVSLPESDQYEVVGESVNKDICIHPDTSESISLKVKPVKAGKVNITVRAETSDSNQVCGDSTVYDGGLAKDALTQSFECEPEGYPAEQVESQLFCPTDEDDQTFRSTYSLVLPEDVVPDSSRAIVDVTGNVMGPAIDNLDNLVSLPTGCGEQNMVKFTPNYLVLDYLQDIGQLTDTIKTKAKRNLMAGYQRELKYRHNDGSFSAFGETDKEGSMFLTAFVMKSFYEAARYILIDNSVITACQNWIVSKQQPDGCFPNVGHIVDRGIQGGLEKEKNTGAITAYVAAALVASNYENQTVIDNAMNCLSEDTDRKPYDAFLYAYAEAIAGKIDAAKKRLDDIRPYANKTDGVEYYRNPNGTKSLDLETAAYAVLAKLQVGESKSDVIGLVRYMSQHFNPSGGFYSTQDTCVGLDAMSKFAKLVYTDPVDIAVTYSGILDGVKEINEDNKMLVQRSYVTNLPGDLNVEASGSGCALIQTTLRYNTKNPPRKQSFYLEVVGECKSSDCKKTKIRITTSYIPSGKEAGMTIVEIKMVTGYVPDKDSINNLKADKNNDILRIDVEGNTVVIYFSTINNAGQDVSFDCEQVVEVDDAQPGTAKVSDYYAPELTASTSYSFGRSDIYGSSPGSESTEP